MTPKLDYIEALGNFIEAWFDPDKTRDWERIFNGEATARTNNRSPRSANERNVELVTMVDATGSVTVSFERVPVKMRFLPFYRVKWRLLEVLDMRCNDTVHLMPEGGMDIDNKYIVSLFKSIYPHAKKWGERWRNELHEKVQNEMFEKLKKRIDEVRPNAETPQ